MISENNFTYYINNLLLCIEKKYQGWAINRGRLIIVRNDKVVKIFVAKQEDESIKKIWTDKTAELIFSCSMTNPYEAKNQLNKLLKPYKTSKHNNYEYIIENEKLKEILMQSNLHFSYPKCGLFAHII